MNMLSPMHPTFAVICGSLKVVGRGKQDVGREGRTKVGVNMQPAINTAQCMDNNAWDPGHEVNEALMRWKAC